MIASSSKIKVAAEQKQSFESFKKKVQGANINENTLLATDYLNHFNEIIIIIEMVPVMPEILEKAKEWRPKTYPQYFCDSAFSDKELAIEAYNHVPQRYRGPFEKTISQMNRLASLTIFRVEKELDAANAELVEMTTPAATQLLRRLVDHASSIIHGSEKTIDQQEIDAFLS